MLQQDEITLSRLFSNIEEIVYQVSVEGDPLGGKVTFVSSQVTSILGYEPEEFLSDPGLWFKILHPEDALSIKEEASQQQASDVSEQPHKWTRQYRLKHKLTGEYRWMEDKTVAERDKERRLIRVFGAARDITDRKQADVQLEFQAAVLQSVHHAVIVTDLEGRIIYWNDGATAVFGYSSEEMLGQTPSLLYPDLALEKWVFDLGSVAAGKDYIGEWKGRRKDGTAVWIGVKTTVMRDPAGKAVGFIGVARDITERKRSESALRDSEERWRSLFKGMPVPTYAWRAVGGDFVLTDYNNAAEVITRGSVARLQGMKARTLYADTPDIVEDMARCFAEKAAIKRQMDYCFRTTGEVRRLAVTYGFVPSDIIIVNAEDVTEHVQAEEKLERSRRQLRDLAGHLRTVREEDRVRLAREIHDEFGQALTALRLDLAWTKDRLPSQSKGSVRKMQAMLARIDTMIDKVRTLARELRPPMLDDLGLVAAIEWEAQQFTSRTGVPCQVEVPVEFPQPDAARSIDVFRIFQEALTNIARHANASSVTARLVTTQEQLVLDVHDDGRGITEAEASDPHSLGLLGMRERALSWEGEISIGVAPGGGTTVAVRVPLSPTSQDATDS